MAQTKRPKVGKGIIFSDLIQVRGLKKKTDQNGRNYQSFWFIIGNDMGFANCSYYGSVELQDKAMLKLLKGRWCPKTVGGHTFQNIRVESFEIYQKEKTQEQIENDFFENGGVKTETTKTESKADDLSWIDDEQIKETKKSNEDEMINVEEINFNE